MITVAVSTTGDLEGLIEALTLAGLVAVDVDEAGPGGDWALALVDLRSDPVQQLRSAKRIHEDVGCPIVVSITSSQTGLLENERWIDDFVQDPIDTLELRLRIHRLSGDQNGVESLRYKS